MIARPERIRAMRHCGESVKTTLKDRHISYMGCLSGADIT